LRGNISRSFCCLFQIPDPVKQDILPYSYTHKINTEARGTLQKNLAYSSRMILEDTFQEKVGEA
jgi:hypothetical protein